jgi:hypothetical protein
VDKMKRHGYDIRNIRFADTLTIPVFPMNVLDASQVDRLKDTLVDIQPVLVVIDTLREAFPGDENSSDIMRNVITNIVSFSRPAAVLLLSHQRKDGLMAQERLQDDLMGDARGSSYVSGRMDNVIRLTDHTLTVKGRSVNQTTWKILPAPKKYDEDDPNSPPPMVVFESEDEKELLEVVVQRLVQEHPKISANKAAETIVEQKLSNYSVDHLRQDLLPDLLKKYRPKLVA